MQRAGRWRSCRPFGKELFIPLADPSEGLASADDLESIGIVGCCHMATIGKERLLHSAECLSLAIEQPDVLEFVFDDDRVKSPILADGLVCCVPCQNWPFQTGAPERGPSACGGRPR